MNLSFKKEVFEGSIFDGELIKTKSGSWNYLMHDCMTYCGVNYTKKPHRLRYAAIIDFINKRYVNKETDCFNIKTKIFYNFTHELDKTWKCISDTTENNIDGLIFTPINQPIKFGRDYTLFKWKEPDNHTIDLLVKSIGNQITLSGINYLFKTFEKKSENYKNIVNFCNINKVKYNNIIIEFKYIPKSEIFIPYRLRLDKDKPNGEITITNTLKNINEALLIKDFC
jgi:hypothetical protein